MSFGIAKVVDPSHARLRNLNRFAVATTCATFLLIFAGGLVTSTGSALAVPDWPLSFGRLFPPMVGGVLYEHGHRMIAGVVTILTLTLMIWTLRAEERPWVRVMAVGAFCLILIQAILGGLTVLLKLPLAIAVAHAACAQAFFCLMVALSVITGESWQVAEENPHRTTVRTLARISLVTTVVIYLQVLVGAVMRHMGAGLVIPDFPTSFGRWIPPVFSLPIAINFAHRVGALTVAVFAVVTVAYVLRFCRDNPFLVREALLLGTLLVVQLSLGAVIVWSRRAVLPTTAHVAVGAALLATSLVLCLRAYRFSSFRRAERAFSEVNSLGRAEKQVTA